jgi:hypothetical protein
VQTQVAGEFAASAIPALEDGFMHGLEVCLYLTVNALHLFSMEHVLEGWRHSGIAREGH